MGKKKTAVIISGGGSKGAFAVGIIKSLYDNYRQEGWFDICGGTSTGALIAPMAALMACEDETTRKKVLETLVRIYTNVSTRSILNKENIFQLIFRMHSLYQSEPLNELIYENFQPEWFNWLQGETAPECYVVYVNYQNGEKVVVSPKDKGMTREKFIRAMMASSSVPIVMEATTINGNLCYDGGVRDLLPFSQAIERGATTIFPIFLDPENLYVQDKPRRRIDKVMMRTFEILVDEVGQNDYKVASLINIAIRIKNDLLQAFAGDKQNLEKINAVLGNEEYEDLVGAKKRLLDIVTGLRPDHALTDNTLKFDPKEMKKWLKMGEEKAAQIITQSPF